MKKDEAVWAEAVAERRCVSAQSIIAMSEKQVYPDKGSGGK